MGEVEISNSYRRPIGHWDPTGLGLGGWTMTQHHTYDPATETIHFGDGTHRQAAPAMLSRVGGHHPANPSDPNFKDGGPALDADFNINAGGGMDIGPDGSLYFVDFQHDRIRKIAPTARLPRRQVRCGLLGYPRRTFAGDGGPATRQSSTDNEVVVAAMARSTSRTCQWSCPTIDPDHGTI